MVQGDSLNTLTFPCTNIIMNQIGALLYAVDLLALRTSYFLEAIDN